jgi:hypothetical protein
VLPGICVLISLPTIPNNSKIAQNDTLEPAIQLIVNPEFPVFVVHLLGRVRFRCCRICILLLAFSIPDNDSKLSPAFILLVSLMVVWLLLTVLHLLDKSEGDENDSKWWDVDVDDSSSSLLIIFIVKSFVCLCGT